MRRMIAVLAVGGSLASAQNLLVNGNFESPLISSPFVTLTDGSTALDGWLVQAPQPLQGVDVVSATFFGNPTLAHDGAQSIDMAGTPGPGALVQTIATTIGETYRVRLWLSSNIGPFQGSLEVYWGGELIATHNSPAQGTWLQQCQIVTATATQTQIRLVGTRTGNSGALLDNTSVEVFDRANCPGNIDEDCGITLTDLATQLANYGTSSGATPGQGDLDGDGDIDLVDLATLLANFGSSCAG